MGLECIEWKIDYYINHYIKPRFDLERIHWFFSLSGGKDSFVLADSICNWYKWNNKRITATGLHILQWDDSRKEIESRFSWLDNLLFWDARGETSKLYKANKPNQISCSDCSGIRKKCSDNFFGKLNVDRHNMINILCRGLHLTDMANSMLWRLLWEKNPIDSILKQNKGKPLVKLFSNLYLAKPLCLVREFESQNYSEFFNYKAYQCDCPALVYPGRRDIIEESITLFYSDLLWEFQIPGMDSFFSSVLECDKELISHHSMPGKESKRPTLSEEYFQFAVDHFYTIIKKNQYNLFQYISNFNVCLEDYMPNFLLHNQSKYLPELNLNFKLLLGSDELTQFDKRMISTLGPLWGAFALNESMKEQALQIQKEIFNFSLDSAWGQVNGLLKLFYMG